MGILDLSLKFITKGAKALKFGGKSFTKTTKAAKAAAATGAKSTKGAAAAAKATAAKPNVPIGQTAAAAGKIRSGMKPDHVREFIGKDVMSEEEALNLATKMQERLPDNCRIDLVIKDGSSLTLSKEIMSGTNMFIPVANVPCTVTGAGNRLRFLNQLTRSIENNPAKYGF